MYVPMKHSGVSDGKNTGRGWRKSGREGEGNESERERA